MTIDEKIRLDAERRDFTVNALYEDSKGNIIDPTGMGFQDLVHSQLRFVGKQETFFDKNDAAEQRIAEDNLRLLRLFRFQATKDFNFNACKAHELVLKFKDDFLKNVSAERIGQEMRKMIVGDWIDKFIYDIDSSGILDIVIKGWADLRDKPCPSEWHTTPNAAVHSLEVFTTMCKLTKYLDDDLKFERRTAALMHDLGKGPCQTEDGHAYGHADKSAELAAETLKNLWRIDKKASANILDMIKVHMDAHHLYKTKSNIEVWKFLGSRHDSLGTLQLLNADNCDVPEDQDNTYKILIAKFGDPFAVTGPKVPRCLSEPSWKNSVPTLSRVYSPLPKAWITGQDLIDAGGKPGKGMKRALEVAYDFQLRSEYNETPFMKDRIIKQSIETLKQVNMNT